jgi:hypothetical protein
MSWQESAILQFEVRKPSPENPQAGLETAAFPLTAGAPSSGTFGKSENDAENQLKR